jgi:hypothetical protein
MEPEEAMPIKKILVVSKVNKHVYMQEKQKTRPN